MNRFSINRPLLLTRSPEETEMLIGDYLEPGLVRVGALFEAAMVKRFPVGATRNLVKSIDQEILRPAPLRRALRVGPTVGYALPLFLGRAAAMPPVEPIVSWVAAMAARGAAFTGTDERAQRNIAWRIAVSKSKRATPPNTVLDDIAADLEPRAVEELTRAVDALVKVL